MSSQLTANTHISLTGLQIVDGADVVQAATCDIVTGRGISARHHPRGAQRDGMDLKRRKILNIMNFVEYINLYSFEGTVQKKLLVDKE